MKQYLDNLNRILTTGVREENRTGIATYKVHGVFFEHDMQEGFPIITTKEVNWKSAVAETLGFIKGFDNAAQFRQIGSKVWDANANETTSWLNSPHRKGEDDLGRIYGVQMRGVKTDDGTFDQLAYIVSMLRNKVDNRRLICDYWNAADIQEGKMALPPCHHNWQVGIIDRKREKMIHDPFGLMPPTRMSSVVPALDLHVHI